MNHKAFESGEGYLYSVDLISSASKFKIVWMTLDNFLTV